eukprot:7310056-Prymnesium_polylepis.1
MYVCTSERCTAGSAVNPQGCSSRAAWGSPSQPTSRPATPGRPMHVDLLRQRTEFTAHLLGAQGNRTFTPCRRSCAF